jgi:hypothetical protein
VTLNRKPPWLTDAPATPQEPATRPRKPRATDPITPEVRGLVRKRSKGKCELCGATGTHMHHRQLRRSGDHSAANIVNTCTTCHQRLHARVRWALDTGWIVSSYETDPATVPILIGEEWCRLDRDGCVTPA